MDHPFSTILGRAQSPGHKWPFRVPVLEPLDGSITPSIRVQNHLTIL
jgi:hypothetical protein